jgi:hypothetical protein
MAMIEPSSKDAQGHPVFNLGGQTGEHATCLPTTIRWIFYFGMDAFWAVDGLFAPSSQLNLFVDNRMR